MAEAPETPPEGGTTPDGGEPEGTQPDTKTFTQAELDDLIEKRLARERQKYSDYDDLKKRVTAAEDAKKTELEKLTDAKTTAEKEAAAATAKALRLEVAIEKAPEGMPISKIRTLAKRLHGDTREELEADADELFADFAPDDGKKPPGRKPEEHLRGGRNPEIEPDIDPEKLAEEIYSRGRL